MTYVTFLILHPPLPLTSPRVQTKQSILPQGSLAQGLLLVRTSFSFVPVFSTILILSPSTLFISSSAAFKLLVNYPPSVKSTNNTASGSVWGLVAFISLLSLVLLGLYSSPKCSFLSLLSAFLNQLVFPNNFFLFLLAAVLVAGLCSILPFLAHLASLFW